VFWLRCHLRPCGSCGPVDRARGWYPGPGDPTGRRRRARADDPL